MLPEMNSGRPGLSELSSVLTPPLPTISLGPKYSHESRIVSRVPTPRNYIKEDLGWKQFVVQLHISLGSACMCSGQNPPEARAQPEVSATYSTY